MINPIGQQWNKRNPSKGTSIIKCQKRNIISRDSIGNWSGSTWQKNSISTPPPPAPPPLLLVLPSTTQENMTSAKVAPPRRRRRRHGRSAIIAAAATTTAALLFSSFAHVAASSSSYSDPAASIAGGSSGGNDDGGNSRAYPLGCLHRHPSYYTYDERERLENEDPYDGGANVGHHRDFRRLPSRSSDMRVPYERYVPTRKLGSGKFSDVYEAMDVIRREELEGGERRIMTMKGKRRRRSRKRIDGGGGCVSSSSSSSSERIRRLKRRRRKTRRRRRGGDDGANDGEDTSIGGGGDENYCSTGGDNIECDYEGKCGGTLKSRADIHDDFDVNDVNDDERGLKTRKDFESSTSSSLVVLKCLKPISERKVRRELLILTHCTKQRLPNLARLMGIVLPDSMNDDDIRDRNSSGDGGRGLGEDYDAEMKITCDNGDSSLSRQKAAVAAMLERRKRAKRPDDGQWSSSTRSTTTGGKSKSVRHLDEDGHRDDAMEGNVPPPFGTTAREEQLGQRWRTRQPIAFVLEHAGPESQWLCHDGRQRRRGRAFHRGNDDDNRDGDGNHNGVREEEEDDNFLSELEVKYYLCHLLVALDALHAAGIMHRDVKPRNTLINRFPSTGERNDGDRCLRRRHDEDGDVDRGVASPPEPHPPLPLMLVDLGLADFYHPGKSYNVRVASRHYKAPELLIGYEEYDYSVDMWAFGCILVGLLFRREPFFHGRDNDDQLGQIVSVLGIRDFLRYYRRVGRLRSSRRRRADNDDGGENDKPMKLSYKARAAIGRYCSWAPDSVSSLSSSKSSSEEEEVPSSSSTPINSDMGYRKPWLSFLSPTCPVPSPQGLDLLDKLLVYDHELRWTAREALGHEFFDDVRSQVLEEVRKRMEWEKNRCQS
jgi:serine/threonine protein kinase